VIARRTRKWDEMGGCRDDTGDSKCFRVGYKESG
jgi:hypothetical protein